MARRSRSASRSPSRRRRRDEARHHEEGARARRDRGRDRDRERERRRPRSRSLSRSRSRRRSSADLEPPAPVSSAAASTTTPAAPKTTEDNGEISMSIEETNKLRAALGLKPLSVGPQKDTNVVNLQKTSAQVAEEQERASLQKALEQSRRKRELTQKLAGKSIGEQLKASAAGSALDWVKQSRAKPTAPASSSSSHRREVAETTGADGAAAYDATALAGMTVGHDAGAFDEGTDVVLTLRDTRVLTTDGNDINDEDDELVNVELAERDQREARQKRALRASMPVYSGVDDDEFISMGGALKKKKKLLAQYDEDEEVKEAEEARKFTLDSAGGSHAAAVAAAAANQRANEDLDGVEVVSLSMDKTKAIDDYYTKAEMEAQFAKKSKKLRKKKKLRKMDHHAEGDEHDPAATSSRADATATTSAGSLLAQLEAEAAQAGDGRRDRGRRRRVTTDEDNEEENNLRRFQEAREKANAIASNAVAGLPTSPKRKKRRTAGLDEMIMEDAAELSATLARARQIAQRATNATNSETPLDAEAKIAQLVSQALGTDADGDATMATSGPKPSGNVFVDDTSTQNAVVFNDATDFETRLKSAMELRSSQFQATKVSATTSTMTALKPAEAGEDEDGDDMDIDDDESTADNGHNGDENDETKEEGAEGWADDQPLVGAGMGATLALLRRTGELRDTGVERQAGRANDARDRNIEEDLRIKDGVKLDYRDEFGRLLTKKEAFRMLSYKFHGHKPGKKKQEKRLKQLKEELAAQKMLSGEGSTKMMKTLEKKQQHAKQAHVVLSGGT